MSPSAKVSWRRPSWLTVEISKTRNPRASSSGRTRSARSFASGTSILLSATSCGRSRSGSLPLGHGVRGEFGEDDVEVAERVAAGLERRAVEHVHQRGAALDVAEELQPEALALAGALDEAGDVGDGEAHVARLDDAEVRMQGRERVVGDLRARRRDGGDEARLAGRGVADERDVGDGLQLEEDVALPAGRAEQREARAPCAWASRAPRCRARPCPPGATTKRMPGSIMSTSVSPAASLTTVPTGTGSSSASPAAPERWSPMPKPPLPAERCGEWWYDSSVVTCGSATSTMSPPLPAVAAVGTGERLELLAPHRHAAVAALARATGAASLDRRT